MNEDNTFQALFSPGEAENFFEVTGLADFEPDSTVGYSRTNALWLAEFSRLIYRQERDEVPQRPSTFQTRDGFLSPHGWHQAASDFFNVENTQAGLFVNPTVQVSALVFRGTLGLQDTITDLEFIPRRWQGRGNVHEGFRKALDAVWDLIKARLLNEQNPVFFTGHSLGAALATLAAARCLTDPSMASPAALYTFGSPRVGDVAFGRSLQGLFHCRVVDDEDVVPTVPPVLDNPLLPTFHHAGQLHKIEHDGHLHIFPTDIDVLETRRPFSGIINLARALNDEFRDLRKAKLSPPKPLADHAPVNYTARLERAS